MRNFLLLISLIVLLFGCQIALNKDSSKLKNNNQSNSITIGSVHTLTSEVMNEEREIIISLPEGYEKSIKSTI